MEKEGISMSEEKKNLTEEERKALKENMKKQIDEMSDEELDEVAGGLEIGETWMIPKEIMLYPHTYPWINKEMIGKISFNSYANRKDLFP